MHDLGLGVRASASRRAPAPCCTGRPGRARHAMRPRPSLHPLTALESSSVAAANAAAASPGASADGRGAKLLVGGGPTRHRVASISLRRRGGPHAVGPQVGAGGVQGEALPLDGGRQLWMLVAPARREDGERERSSGEDAGEKPAACGALGRAAWGVGPVARGA